MGLANETVSWSEMIPPPPSKVQPLSPLVCEIPLWELQPVLEISETIMGRGTRHLNPEEF